MIWSSCGRQIVIFHCSKENISTRMELHHYAFGYNGFGQIIQKTDRRILETPVKWDIWSPEKAKRENCSGFAPLEDGDRPANSCQRQSLQSSTPVFRGQTDDGGTSQVTTDDHSGNFSVERFGALQMKWNVSVYSSAGFIVGYLNGQETQLVNFSTHLLDVMPSPRHLCLHEDSVYFISDQGECFVQEGMGDAAMKVSKVFLEGAPSSYEVPTRGSQTAVELRSHWEERCKALEGELIPACIDEKSEQNASSITKASGEHPIAAFTNICSGDSHVLATYGSGNQPGKITKNEDGEYIFHPFLQPIEVQKISCGKEHALLLTAQGLVYSYGMGSRGQLGHGRIGREDEPKLVEAIACVAMVKVSAGGWHSACVSAIGDLYVWGWNESGQLGLSPLASKGLLGEPEDESQPAHLVTFQMTPAILDLPGEINVTKVSCGSRHTAAVTYDKRLYTWGWGKYGQLGHGDVQSSEVPKQVDFFRQNRLDVLDVTCGDWSTVVCTRPSPGPGPS